MNNDIISNQSELKNGEFNNHKLTEYFPVRRSVRKTQKAVLEQKQRNLETALRTEADVGLEVCNPVDL